MDSDVTTLFNPILIVTRTEVSEDLVYQVTKALLDTHKEDFKAIHPNAALFNIENAGKSMVVPIHPGEAKFYAEMGVSRSAGLRVGKRVVRTCGCRGKTY